MHKVVSDERVERRRSGERKAENQKSGGARLAGMRLERT